MSKSMLESWAEHFARQIAILAESGMVREAAEFAADAAAWAENWGLAYWADVFIEDAIVCQP